MKLKKSDFSKLLSPETRGWLDAKQWGKIRKIIKKVIVQELLKGNSIQTEFGEFSCVENLRSTTIFNGKEIPIKNKYQVRCSCSNQFKEIVNGKRK
jgi:nucleoid DNA-binding protein